MTYYQPVKLFLAHSQLWKSQKGILHEDIHWEPCLKITWTEWTLLAHSLSSLDLVTICSISLDSLPDCRAVVVEGLMQSHQLCKSLFHKSPQDQNYTHILYLNTANNQHYCFLLRKTEWLPHTAHACKMISSPATMPISNPKWYQLQVIPNLFKKMNPKPYSSWKFNGISFNDVAWELNLSAFGAVRK